MKFYSSICPVAAMAIWGHAAQGYNLSTPSTQPSKPEATDRNGAVTRRGLISATAAVSAALLVGGEGGLRGNGMGVRSALAIEEGTDVLTPLYFGVGVRIYAMLLFYHLFPLTHFLTFFLQCFWHIQVRCRGRYAGPPSAQNSMLTPIL